MEMYQVAVVLCTLVLAARGKPAEEVASRTCHQCYYVHGNETMVFEEMELDYGLIQEEYGQFATGLQQDQACADLTSTANFAKTTCDGSCVSAKFRVAADFIVIRGCTKHCQTGSHTLDADLGMETSYHCCIADMCNDKNAISLETGLDIRVREL